MHRTRPGLPGRAGRVLAVSLTLALGLTACVSLREEPDPVPSTVPPSAVSGPPAGVTDPATLPALERFYGQALDWVGCEDDFECAELVVPLDWDDPGGETIRLGLLRLRSEGDRIGSLVVNPGGPGVSGIAYAKAARQAFGRAVLRRYDVVGFDPRGVGESSPVECLPDSQLEAYVAADSTPDDAAELRSVVADVRRFAAACRANTGELLEHVDTISVVRDLDVLRAALGEDVLTYQGASYGTFIGAWYAERFPWRVGRMVLDGAVDPSISAAEYVAGQAEGFSRALRAFVVDCVAQSQCPLRGTPEQALEQLGRLVERADSASLRTDQGRRLTQSLMITGIAQGLYDDSLWPALTVGIGDALTGDGTGLLRLADVYLERDENGGYGQTLAANPAIYCLDVSETRSVEQIADDAERMQQRFPPLGGAIAWGALGCAQWPVDAVVPRQKLTAPGSAPILVLGTTEDPATPYEWAQGLASQLSAGRLLTWEGSVHTAYNQGSECVDDAVEAYLLAGTLPAVGTRCR